MNSLKPAPSTQTMYDEALAHQRAGRLADADRIYRQILTSEPHHADSLHMLGIIAQTSKQTESAISLLRQAIAVTDDRAAYHYNLGCMLQAQGKLEEAAACYERAIALHPQLTPAYLNLANVTKALGHIDEAVRHCERAVAFDPANADAHYNLATLLKDAGRFSEAIEQYQLALDINPDHATAHNNLGVLLRERGEHSEALRHFRAAISAKPDHAEAHVNEAMTLLLLGEMEEGWRHYEWRWRVKGAKPFASGKPLWDGGDLHGKTILLRAEQGLGDSIQFVRYAPLVEQRGGRVILISPKQLARLFKEMDSIDAVIPEGGDIPEYDVHAPLMSLPLLFNTNLGTVPNAVPYLHPAKDDVAKWAERLQGVRGLKVGLIWAGQSRPDHPTADAVDRRRSVNLSQFAPLADIPGVSFFSLQKGDPARQLATSPLPVTDYMNDMQDFADTAALIANLDLVIGVDTSVVHLAGALGKPVWVLSRFDGCWRWLKDREDSPWYPSLRLFRQPRMGDWEPVIEQVRDALRKLAGG